MCIFLTCCTIERQKENNIYGIWVPEDINWSDGSFETFYFFNDTSYIILTSTQKIIQDSIYFETEPGLILNSGTMYVNNNKTIELKGRILYRFINLSGEATPTNIIKSSIKLNTNGSFIKSFNYGNVKFIKTSKYTKQSVNSIKSISIKMVENINRKHNMN